MSDEQIRAAAWDLISDDSSKQMAGFEAIRQCGGSAAKILLEVAHEWNEESWNRWLGRTAGGGYSDALSRSLADSNAIDALSEAIIDPNPVFRGFAAFTLSEINDPRVPELLHQAFDDQDVVVRGHSIHGMMKYGDQKSFELVLSALQDSNVDVRCRAAFAMRYIGGVEAVEPLIRMLQDPEEIVVVISIVSLGMLGAEAAVEPVIDALESESEKIRNCAIMNGLSRIADQRAVEPLAKQVVINLNKHAIVSALETLCRIDPRESFDLFIQMLKHPDSYVRCKCADLLRKLKADRATNALFEALEDTSPGVRLSAAFALMNSGDPRVLDALVEILHLGPNLQPSKIRIVGISPDKEDANRSLRQNSAKALGTLGDSKAIEPLAEALNDKTTSIQAAISLSKLGDDRGLGYLLERLRNADKYDKREIIEAIGETKSAQALPVIVEKLQDEDFINRAYATRCIYAALAKIGTKEAISALEEIMTNGGESACWSAEELAYVGYEPGINYLCSHIESNFNDQKKDLPSVLKKIDHPRAKNLLLSLLDHPSADIAVATIQELQESNDPEIKQAIKAKLQDPDRRVQTAAFIAINGMNRRGII